MKLKCTKKTPIMWHLLTVTVLSLMSIIILLVIYWTVEPLKPVLEIKNSKVLTPQVKAGEQILFDYDYCKNQDTQSGQVVRYFKDTIITYLPSVQSNVKKGCGHATLGVEVPKNMPPDKYTFNYEVQYKVNPIKTVTYYFESPEFEVIK